MNQIAEVICIANSFGGLYFSCDISKLGSSFCQSGATEMTYVCACMPVCIYTHQYKCIAEVMFAQRKYSIKVQDWRVMSILLNERGMGSKLFPEATCQCLLQLVRVSSCIAISPWRDVAGVVQTEPGSELIIRVYVDDQESSAWVHYLISFCWT